MHCREYEFILKEYNRTEAVEFSSFVVKEIFVAIFTQIIHKSIK